MSHFVSKGADFDELHAKLLQRNTESGEQESHDEIEEAGQHSPQSSSEASHGYEGDPSNAAGTLGERPSSIASYLSETISGQRSSSPFAGAAKKSSSSNTPYNISRKNSEDDLTASLRRSGNRDRKLSNLDDSPHSTVRGKRNEPSKYVSKNSDAGLTNTDDEQQHLLSHAVTSSEEPTLVKAGKAINDGGLTRSNSGVTHFTSIPAAHSLQHHHLQSAQERLASQVNRSPRKLGTWDGVFMPVSLNILGIILFLRFGFILGQVGLLGALLLLIVSYTIDALTAMAVSAISTNGQVRGGGAYYLISRSLGPEFGGSIGLVFFLGQALNATMNVLGFVESLTDAFGESRNGFLPEGPWWSFSYGSVCLLLSTLVCLVGSALFTRATLALAIILFIAILSIPVSSLFVQPFIDLERGAFYTGWSLTTFRENLFPHFTSGAAGSSTGPFKENWQTVFGVLFPAVTGLLAGVSMSGDLRKPSKSIPKGTNWSLIFTFFIYVVSFIVFSATIARQSFYQDVGIVSDVALSPQLITFGVLASTAFSALMGVMACGKVLQAIARDNLLPLLDPFAQGTHVADTPTYAVCATWLLCQAVLFVDSVNLIAQLVTMTCEL